MSIKLRAWDHWNDEMIYSDKFDDLYGFFYSVKRREDGENKVTLMLQSKCEDHDNNPIYEGDILQFLHDGLVKTGIVECRPEHFCYWQVKVPGDNFGLERVIGCYSSAYVTGNRYADREWLEDEGLVGLLDDEFVNQAATNIAEAVEEMDRMLSERATKHPEDFFASPKLATPPIDAGLLNAVIEAMRPIIRAKLEKEVAGSVIQPGELPEIDPEKEKAAKEAMEKLKIFSTEEWARDYSKIHFEPNKKEEIFAGEPGVPISRVEAIQIAGETLEKAEEERLVKPARLSTYYQDDFNHTIKEADILSFKLCGRRLTGEVKRIWSNDRYCWQVWTYESPEMKLSLRHMCEDVACTEVRVIGHISTVRRGGVAVQDIGIQL